MNKIYKLLAIATIMLSASCSTDSMSGGEFNNGTSYSEGKGGSMARFCIVDNILFTVDQSSLNSFDISVPEKPVFLSARTQELKNVGIETIFPMDSLLFIGAKDGMYIYSISNHGLLQQLSTTSHILSCDPVVAQGNYAYVTLNSSNVWCGRNSNILQVYDITDLTKPKHIRNIEGFVSPKGMGIDGDKLFVCDRILTMYDISDREFPTPKYDLYNAHIYDVEDAYDVITLNNETLILVASSGIYQLDYSDDTFRLISKIEVKRKN
ncbi:MAG: hypothetical protein LBK97_04450 [Prevotellaceae bacterium]|jgi:hypothetical protein|nr:hypothetical protein [Prevotellaceae bacterium]